LLVFVGIAPESSQDRTPGKLWTKVKREGAFVLSIFIISGFWLVRNYVQLDNPLYPVHLPMFELLGWQKAPDIDFSQRLFTQNEWVRSPIEWFIYPWVEWHSIGENFKASSGLGPFFAATVPVACLSTVVSLVNGQKKTVGHGFATLRRYHRARGLVAFGRSPAQILCGCIGFPRASCGMDSEPGARASS
jgi:hypothetical protein